MAWTFSFFSGADPITRLCYGDVISEASATPGGSAASVTVPANAGIVRIKADSAGGVTNNGTASATKRVSLASGDEIDLKCNSTDGLSIIT